MNEAFNALLLLPSTTSEVAVKVVLENTEWDSLSWTDKTSLATFVCPKPPFLKPFLSEAGENDIVYILACHICPFFQPFSLLFQRFSFLASLAAVPTLFLRSQLLATILAVPKVNKRAATVPKSPMLGARRKSMR